LSENVSAMKAHCFGLYGSLAETDQPSLQRNVVVLDLPENPMHERLVSPLRGNACFGYFSDAAAAEGFWTVRKMTNSVG